MFTKYCNFKVIVSLLILFGGIYSFTVRIKRNNVIRIGIGGEWKTLNPALQHTAYGDLVLSNQFDPLVGSYDTGLPSPLGAASWEISKDDTVFTFHIDGNRKFSDGSKLTAADYKRSWESSLGVDPRSFNLSTADVLYRIVGFEEASKTGKISGIEVISPTILRVHFKEPFRMALEYLSGVRYSAYKKNTAGQLLGTGKYVISEKRPDLLELTVNDFTEDAAALQPIEISVVSAINLKPNFDHDKIDAWVHGDAPKVDPRLFSEKNIGIIQGHEDAHRAAIVNGLEGHPFEKSKYRLAIQSMILRLVKPVLASSAFFSMDEQIFLPFQAGRLKGEEADSLIKNGINFENDLKKYSQSFPLTIYYSQESKWLFQSLEADGLGVSNRSHEVSASEYIHMIYKETDYDLFLSRGFSVVSGDPDGIYHSLGKNGAILCPVTYRKKINTLLERGRKILEQEDLDEYYKKVSRSVLLEVPFVHLGFGKALTVFRKDRLIVTDLAQRRNDGHLDIFHWK